MDDNAQAVLSAIGADERFALPERTVRPYVDVLHAMGIEPERRWIKIKPFVLDAYVFQRPRESEAVEMFDAAMSGLDPVWFSTKERCRAGRRKMPYFCGAQGETRFVPKKPGNEQIGKHHPYPQLMEVIERLSRLSGGLHVNLHEEQRGSGPHPRPDKDRTIEIYPWMHPPGESGDEYYARLFGEFIGKDGQSILTYSGVPGRGVFVSDGKKDVAQYCGSNWYLLFSVVEFYNVHSTRRILTHALAKTLHSWQCAELKTTKRPLGSTLDRKTFIDTVTTWANWQADSIDDVLREQEERISSLKKELAQLERQNFDLRGIRNAIKERGTLKELIGSFPEQWRRIRGNAHVESVMLVRGGIHVRTRRIVISHGGHSYPMGRFVIRISKEGVLSIWNEDRLHPDGVPHPHIDSQGTPCMGNATSAVGRAASEHRYADAVEYTLRWLTEGYEEKLALHKIEQWPYEEIREDGRTVSCVRLDTYGVGDIAGPEEEGRPA